MKKKITLIMIAFMMIVSMAAAPVSAAGYIGKTKAKKIALKNAGYKESQVKGLKVELDKEDNEYEVDFKTSKHKYEYNIHATKGKIHEKEIKVLKRKKSTGKKVIGKKKALEIALKNAKVKKSGAKHIEVELEKSKGVKYYDIEFSYKTKEYEYEIDAERKTILKKAIENTKYR